jgi:hypothetical protein
MEKTDTQQFKTVAKFSEPMPAEILAAKLNDNGIPAGVFGASSPYPCLNYAHPIEVKVNADDFERALALVPEEDRSVEE